MSAAAAGRAVAAVLVATDGLVSALGRLARGGISGDQFSDLDGLRRALAAPASSEDALARADREDAVAQWLSAHGVDRDWVIAPPLAAGGADLPWCERAAALLPG